MGDTTARIAVIGAEGAAHLLVTRFPDPTTPEVQQIKADFTARYNANTATPWIAAERGYIDRVILPRDTRAEIAKVLRLLRTKRASLPPKKHGNIPL